jgi:hypothetical protein
VPVPLAKEWILNSAMNRFQLNFKRNVGAVSEAIRTCGPRTLDDWRAYYYANIRPREHVDDLGRKLYVKTTEVIAAEVGAVTEQDCIAYMHEVVIDRAYDGDTTEIQTVYGQLQSVLGVPIDPAPDEWDRGYNVDFVIRVDDKFIGLQINPVSDMSTIPQIYTERGIQAETHRDFTSKYGGAVFYVYSAKEGNTKRIQNPDVIEHLRAEIQRLREAGKQ